MLLLDEKTIGIDKKNYDFNTPTFQRVFVTFYRNSAKCTLCIQKLKNQKKVYSR